MSKTSLLAVLALALPLTAQNIKVGDKVTDTHFPTFLNGDGRQNLADFYGQPVVIDCWGVH